MELNMEVLETIFFPAIGVFLIVAVLVWFYQLTKLFNYLQQKHPETYTAMGKPAIFTNNTPSNNVAFLKFLLGTQHKELGDNYLEQWCKLLACFFYVYLIIFFGIFTYLIVVSTNAS